MAGEEHAGAHSKPAEETEWRDDVGISECGGERGGRPEELRDDVRIAGLVCKSSAECGGESGGPPEETEWRNDVGIAGPICKSSAECGGESPPVSEGSRFRRLCSLSKATTSSPSPPSSTSPMLAALKGAVVHESTGRHQGQVAEEPKSRPSLLPPALYLDGIKPYVKGSREQRVKGAGPWVDKIGIDMPPLRNSSSDDDDLYMVKPAAGQKPAESDERDDVGISVSHLAGSAVTNSMCDAPKAPAAASKVENAEDDWEEIKRCCGVRVTSSAGLVCLAMTTTVMSCLCDMISR